MECQLILKKLPQYINLRSVKKTNKTPTFPIRHQEAKVGPIHYNVHSRSYALHSHYYNHRRGYCSRCSPCFSASWRSGWIGDYRIRYYLAWADWAADCRPIYQHESSVVDLEEPCYWIARSSRPLAAAAVEYYCTACCDRCSLAAAAAAAVAVVADLLESTACETCFGSLPTRIARLKVH